MITKLNVGLVDEGVGFEIRYIRLKYIPHLNKVLDNHPASIAAHLHYCSFLSRIKNAFQSH